MAPSRHRSSSVICWCSTIRGRTRICLPSIAAMAARSGRRIARCSSTDGRPPCIGVTTGSTRSSCWAVTSSRTSGSWRTTWRMEPSAGGLAACRRAGRARRSLAAGYCSLPRRTSSWSRRLNDGTLNAPRSCTRTTRRASWRFVRAARAKSVQTNIAWSERKGVPGVPSPLYYNGRLYTVQNGGIVYCRLAKTGELLYTGRLGAPGYYYSSPVAADQQDLHCLRRWRRCRPGCRRRAEDPGDEHARWWHSRDAGPDRREHLREDRESPVRVWDVIARPELKSPGRFIVAAQKNRFPIDTWTCYHQLSGIRPSRH